jgi:Tol biopolymer transport system component
MSSRAAVSRWPLAAAATLVLGLALCTAASGHRGQETEARGVFISAHGGFEVSKRVSAAGARGAGVRTVATISRRVEGFAQNSRYLGWLEFVKRPLSPCPFVLQDLRSGLRRRIARGPGCVGSGPLVMAGDRGYWLDSGGSNLQYYARLMTASLADPRIRQISFQSVSNDGSEQLVPPVSDGRSAYFWSSPEDLTPGPLLRFDGLRQKRLTGAIRSLQVLAAAKGRYALAPSLRTFDCAQEPAWSPDGRRIAFASAADPWTSPCRGGLWVMNADGKGAHQIAAKGRNPDWSPDGSKLAFDVSGNIAVADANGANARTLVPNGVDPAWSPDGTMLAFERQKTIAVVRADGTAAHVVALDAGQPDWSPDGTRLVFTKRSTAGRGLAIVDLDGTNLRSLTADYDSQPAWSPDGRWIAYVHCWGPHLSCHLLPFSDATVIAVIAPDGTGQRELPKGVDLEETFDRAPSWSPDSGDVAFARLTEDSHIFKFSGLRVARRLTKAPPPRTPIVVHARDGRPLLRAEPRGVVVALAVTRAIAAAIVRDGAAWRLEIYSPRRRNILLPRRPAPELAASGGKLVLRIGRSIFALSVRSGGLHVVARAASTPIGLSIVGRRVAWAENIHGGARVRALTLRP